MKLVHTSDWHVGVELGTIDRRSDLEAALEALVDLTVDVSPDLIVHTGDLFDRALPAGNDVRFAADVLCRLAAVAPVLVICGNHDGRATFAGIDKFCSVGGDRLRLLAQLDVRDPLLIWPTADGGRVRVGAVPFQPLAAAGFPALADGTLTAGAYADRIRQLWAVIGAAFEVDRRPGDVDIAAAHLHVTGAVLSRSERLVHVSDDAATDPAALPAVSYAAYGHIHRPQALPGRTGGRYAGSAIPIDFGEQGETKGAVVVDAAPGRAARIEPVTLVSGRPLVTVTGALADLGGLLAGHPNSIIRVQVSDAQRIDHLAARVGDLLAEGATCFSVAQPALQRAPTRIEPSGGEASVLNLLADYAAAAFQDPAVVEGLKGLWSTASDDPDADLSAGALTILESVLDSGPPMSPERHDAAPPNATAEAPSLPPKPRRGRPKRAG